MQTIIDYIAKNKEWIFSGIGVLLLSALFWFVRSLWSKSLSRKKSEPVDASSTKTLKGIVTIPLESEKSYEVFYPRKFQNPPFLTIKCISGRMGVDVIEQRNDGFRLSTYRGGYSTDGGIKVEWVAEGEFEANLPPPN
jgi:hypothetical protein